MKQQAPKRAKPKRAKPELAADTKDIAELSQESLAAQINKKSKGGAARKIVTLLEETEAGTSDWGAAGIRPDARTYRVAIRSLLKLNRTELAIHVYRMRMEARLKRTDAIASDLPLAANIIRAILRDVKNRKTQARDRDDVFSEMKADCAAFIDMGSVEGRRRLDRSGQMNGGCERSLCIKTGHGTTVRRRKLSGNSVISSAQNGGPFFPFAALMDVLTPSQPLICTLTDGPHFPRAVSSASPCCRRPKHASL
ncbi:unnamed protein product [Chondrus crispus]|uniref:Uncharacterized protein n=1 Tax=Chondrus crispus TaxID=2769 RepID=R7Q9B6_CHOCR|nr:unnamed protein product [Chondrus crispus]CDF35127.1 unnamed protein product [Chondrus crispus]|eukprot:XP_005714946.1 unnamed protein product [Chondrus crispus]